MGGIDLRRPCLISEHHDSSDFDCGEETHNYFLQKKAHEYQLNNLSFTYVIAEQKRIIAYYSLAIGSVMNEQALFPVASASSKKSMPVLQLNRLAVDKRNQKQQIGTHILKDALSRACAIAQETGIRCLLVDAINEHAQNFYRQYNFEPWPIDNFRLYMLMKDVRKSLG